MINKELGARLRRYREQVGVMRGRRKRPNFRLDTPIHLRSLRQ